MQLYSERSQTQFGSHHETAVQILYGTLRGSLHECGTLEEYAERSLASDSHAHRDLEEHACVLLKHL